MMHSFMYVLFLLPICQFLSIVCIFIRVKLFYHVKCYLKKKKKIDSSFVIIHQMYVRTLMWQLFERSLFNFLKIICLLNSEFLDLQSPSFTRHLRAATLANGVVY